MSGDQFLSLLTDFGDLMDLESALESPSKHWTPFFDMQETIEQQICVVLDKIIAELNGLKYKDKTAIKQYYVKLKGLLAELPSATYSDITNAEIKSRVDTIWHKTIAKNQGMDRSKEPLLASLTVKARIIMIEHGFYVDHRDTQGKTILFDILKLFNNSLLIPVLEMLRSQGTLTTVLNSVFHNRLLNRHQTLFEYLEAYIERALLKKNHFPKMISILAFYEEFVGYLQTHKIETGFTPQIEEKIRLLKDMASKSKATPKSKIKRRRLIS